MSVEDEALPDSAVGVGDEGEEEGLEESDEESAEEEDDDEEEEEEGKAFWGGCFFFFFIFAPSLYIYPLDARRCKISLNVKSKNALSFYLFIVYCDVINVQTHFNFSKEIILNLEEGVN